VNLLNASYLIYDVGELGDLCALVIFGEYVKVCTCWCLLWMVILVHLMILIDDVYFGENNEV